MHVLSLFIVGSFVFGLDGSVSSLYQVASSDYNPSLTYIDSSVLRSYCDLNSMITSTHKHCVDALSAASVAPFRHGSALHLKT